MSIPELPSTSRRSAGDARPRHAQQEIAELLAAAIWRSRNKGVLLPAFSPGSVPESAQSNVQSEVSLGFSAYQSVNAKPSQHTGVHQ